MFHKYVDLVRTLTENPRFEAHEHSTPTDPAMRFYQDEIKSASSPYSGKTAAFNPLFHCSHSRIS